MSESVEFGPITPILRMFDIAKADEFYLGFLGFKVDWEHRFHDNAPLYRQISRGSLILHQSEHHGDGAPATHIRIKTRGVRVLQQELGDKRYRYMNPGLETTPWGTIETNVIDPFANQITFYEDV